MFGNWIGALLQRVFVPAKGLAELVQLMSALAIAGAATFFGKQMPDGTGDKILAYGAAAIAALLVIRAIWAPYTMWRDQAAEIAKMKAELARPERLVFDHLARHNARDRRKLIQALQEMSFVAHSIPLGQVRTFDNQFRKAVQSAICAGFGSTFQTYINRYFFLCCEFDFHDAEQNLPRPVEVADLFTQHILGAISLEQMGAALPVEIRENEFRRAAGERIKMLQPVIEAMDARKARRDATGN